MTQVNQSHGATARQPAESHHCVFDVYPPPTGNFKNPHREKESLKHPSKRRGMRFPLSVKITHFGVAKHFADEGLTETDDLFGTSSYMAPELTRGGGKASESIVDVYSLGALLYSMFTGRPPFRDETVLDTLEQVRRLEPVPPCRLQPKLPLDLETIRLKCLQNDPLRRCVSSEALANDLQRFLDGKPIVV